MMEDIVKSVLIQAPIDKVWDALTAAGSIAKWMGEPVKSDLHAGGKYAYFGDATTGRYTVVEPPHRLEYTWRQSEWPSEWSDSIVKWELKPDKQGTEVHLVHQHFPNESERSGHDEGWDTYWLEPMKKWLEDNAG
jgi:uncharacterized protein YndB with AHSA1/START domain